MAAIAPISVNDGQATPIAHAYNPVNMEPATYKRNADTSVPVVAQEQLILSLTQSSQASEGVSKARVSLAIPVLETPTGGTGSGYVAAPKVAFILRFNGEFVLPNRSVGTQRKDLRVLASNLLLNAQVVALVDTLEKPY